MNNIIIPPSLQPGDTIGITCPSGYLPPERVLFARRILESWGYKVVTGSTVGSGHYYFSDTDERRRQDLQGMLDKRDIKAIIMGRGGYGLSRIIDQLDFSTFCREPKWICGFSDITVLHNHIHARFGIATLHGPMCAAFQDDTALAAHILSVQQALAGHTCRYPETAHERNRPGRAEGILTGGNLAILAHLSGSVSQADTRGKILFIEDIGEYLYNIDRMLCNLKRAGILEGIAGLVCGGFTDMKDTERPFGQDIYGLILDQVQEYHYPVCFDFPAGHLDINYTLALGTTYTLEVNGMQASLQRAAPSASSQADT